MLQCKQENCGWMDVGQTVSDHNSSLSTLYFLLFQQCFQKSFLLGGSLKVGIVWYRVNLFHANAVNLDKGKILSAGKELNGGLLDNR